MFKETHKFKVSVKNTNYYLVEIKDDVTFEINDLKQLVEFEKELSGKILPILVLCSPSSTTDHEFLNYISKNKNNPYCKAEAFIISSLSQKILVNVYLKLNKPERPVKFFQKKEDGLKWLEQFI